MGSPTPTLPHQREGRGAWAPPHQPHAIHSENGGTWAPPPQPSPIKGEGVMKNPTSLRQSGRGFLAALAVFFWEPDTTRNPSRPQADRQIGASFSASLYQLPTREAIASASCCDSHRSHPRSAGPLLPSSRSQCTAPPPKVNR